MYQQLHPCGVIEPPITRLCSHRGKSTTEPQSSDCSQCSRRFIATRFSSQYTPGTEYGALAVRCCEQVTAVSKVMKSGAHPAAFLAKKSSDDWPGYRAVVQFISRSSRCELGAPRILKIPLSLFPAVDRQRCCVLRMRKTSLSLCSCSQDFYGMDEGLFRKALASLEKQGRAVIFQGATSEEDGVKFLA